MKDLLIASGNKHKVEEIEKIFAGKGINLRNLTEFSNVPDVIEDGITLEENSGKKAKEYFEFTEIPCIADDTGLFVMSLNGDPGVYSARYSGENASYESNCRLLLKNLEGISERSAEFRSVICYYNGISDAKFFEGILKGKIIESPRGTNGFGYDPIFLPDDYDKTFAEMTDEEKNKISHRSKALEKFKEWWDKNKKPDRQY